MRKDRWKLQVHQIYRVDGFIFFFELNEPRVYPGAPALLVQPCSVSSELLNTTLVLADLPNALSLPHCNTANIVLPSACSFQRTADMSLFSGTWAQIVPQS